MYACLYVNQMVLFAPPPDNYALFCLLLFTRPLYLLYTCIKFLCTIQLSNTKGGGVTGGHGDIQGGDGKKKLDE